MRTLLCLLPILCVAAVRGPAWLASIAPVPVADTSLMWVSTNWLQFGTNLNTGTTATNDMSVTVSNAGTGTLSGSASTASPFSVIGASSYAISGTDTTNIVVRYTRSGEQTDTNELALTGGGGTNVHLSGRSTNAPSAGAVGIASSTTNARINVASFTLTNTVSGANRYLLVVVGTSGASVAARDVLSVSSDVDGALSLIATNDDTTWTHSELWGLVAPSAATHIITVSSGDVFAQTAGGAYGLTNVHQSTPLGTAVGATGTGTAPSVSLTLTANDLGIAVIGSDSPTLAVDTGTALFRYPNTGDDTSLGASQITGTGSVAITWTTDNDNYSVVGVPIKVP